MSRARDSASSQCKLRCAFVLGGLWACLESSAFAQQQDARGQLEPPLRHEVPTLALAGAPRCTLGPPRIIAQSPGKRMFAMRLVSDKNGTLLAWSTEPNTVQIATLSKSGEPLSEVRSLPMAGARQFVSLERFDAQHFALLTHHLCSPGIRDHKCIAGRMFTNEGVPDGTEVRHDTNEWMTHTQTENRVGGLLVLYRTTYLGPTLIALDRDDKGQPRMHTVGSFGPCKKDAHVDPGNYGSLSLTGYGGNWYVLRPAIDGTEQTAALCSANKVTPIRGLPSGFDVTAFTVDEGGVALLYQPADPSTESITKREEFWFVRIGLDGKLRGRPRRVDQKWPAPFDETPNVSFGIEESGDNKGVQMLWRRAGGAARGEPLKLPALHAGPRDKAQTDYAWTGDRLLLATTSYEDKSWRVAVRAIRCDGQEGSDNKSASH